jgi:hypothetical protein
MPKTFIIVQSNAPFGHETDTEGEALALAKQLAEAEPGSAYLVYEQLATSVAEPPARTTVTATTTKRSR